MITRETRTWCDNFDRAQVYSTTPGHNGWTIADTSSSGTPTYLNGNDGAVLTLANTSEAEIVTLFQNDVLPFKLRDLQSVEIIAKVAGIDAVTTLVMGLGSAQDDTSDDVTNNAWFRMEGSASTSALVVESDDGTNDNNDVATGKSLASTFVKMVIDFEAGLSNVKFYIDGDRVASSTTFDLSNAASNSVQPFVQLQKASGTGTPAVTIAKFEIVHNASYGS